MCSARTSTLEASLTSSRQLTGSTQRENVCNVWHQQTQATQLRGQSCVVPMGERTTSLFSAAQDALL